MLIHFVEPKTPEYLSFEDAMLVTLGKQPSSDYVPVFKYSVSIPKAMESIALDAGLLLMMKYIKGKDKCASEMHFSFRRMLDYVKSIKTVARPEEVASYDWVIYVLTSVEAKCREFPNHIIRIERA